MKSTDENEQDFGEAPKSVREARALEHRGAEAAPTLGQISC